MQEIPDFQSGPQTIIQIFHSSILICIQEIIKNEPSIHEGMGVLQFPTDRSQIVTCDNAREISSSSSQDTSLFFTMLAGFSFLHECAVRHAKWGVILFPIQSDMRGGPVHCQFQKPPNMKIFLFKYLHISGDLKVAFHESESVCRRKMLPYEAFHREVDRCQRNIFKARGSFTDFVFFRMFNCNYLKLHSNVFQSSQKRNVLSLFLQRTSKMYKCSAKLHDIFKGQPQGLRVLHIIIHGS